MTFKNLIAVLFASSLVVGCAQSGYKTFYKANFDAKISENVALLAEGEEPKIFSTNDFDRDIKILRSKRYIPVGYSSFNGGLENNDNAITQAKAVGATVVLVSSKYTNTQTTTSALVLPDNKTTYHSGTGTANTTYSSSNGGYLGSSNTTGIYNGTSTTYGTKSVPITTHQRRFDQGAVFFVKSTQKLRYGLFFEDLTPEHRKLLERNTGALIDVVIEDTPAFYANLLPGDVLISIDDIAVKNTKHALEIMSNVNTAITDSSKVIVIRNGQVKDVKVNF